MPKINYLSKQKFDRPPPPQNQMVVPLQASCKIAFQRPQSITDKLSVAHCALRVAPFTTSQFRKVFIKIDVEGFEARAMARSNKLFKKLDIRGILMEWLFHRGMNSAETIIHFMQEHNYKPYAFVSWIKPLDLTNSTYWPVDVLWLPDR